MLCSAAVYRMGWFWAAQHVRDPVPDQPGADRSAAGRTEIAGARIHT